MSHHIPKHHNTSHHIPKHHNKHHKHVSSHTQTSQHVSSHTQTSQHVSFHVKTLVKSITILQLFYAVLLRSQTSRKHLVQCENVFKHDNNTTFPQFLIPFSNIRKTSCSMWKHLYTSLQCNSCNLIGSLWHEEHFIWLPWIKKRSSFIQNTEIPLKK